MTTTLLIYIASDNNLKRAGQKDLESIREASKCMNDMNIVVQLDTKESGSRHYFINGKEESEKLEAFNSGDHTILKAFIEESAIKYPSERLIVIVWGHGSGIDDGNPYDAKGNKKLEKTVRTKFFKPRIGSDEVELVGIGRDDTDEDFIDNIELKKALDTSVKIDIVGFDACLMGMFEIAYQLREQIDFMVGSQYIEPSAGWSYERIIEDIKAKDSLEEIASKFVTHYKDFYEGGRKHVTQSAYACSKVERVAENLDGFAKELKSKLSTKDELREILKGVLNFKIDDYIDLIDFVKKANEKFSLGKTDALLTSLDEMIIANITVGKFMENANGVSIYFPFVKPVKKETFEMYKKLDFSQKYPSWIELILYYHTSRGS